MVFSSSAVFHARPPLLRRALVCAATLSLALLISALLRPLVEPNPFIFFFAAIAFCAWYGGFWFGLVTTLIAAIVTESFFVLPSLELNQGETLRLMIFALVSSFICLLSETRFRTEALARAQATQLEVTLASIGDAVIVTDADGRLTFMNAVAEELTGWPMADASGKKLEQVFVILNADTREPVESPAARVLREGRIVGLANHTLLITRDGLERPIDDSGAPLRDEHGAIIGTVLVFRDVTERAQAEEARSALLEREQAARTDAERAREHAVYLSEASRSLAGSLDYALTLQHVSELVVPQLADWCVVDIIADDGSLNMVAAAHIDPDRVKWAHELRRLYPMPADAPAGAPYVIRTGEPQIFPDIPDELLEAVARNPEELEILRSIGYRSVMVVPLRARGRILGALSFVLSESARRFDHDDLSFALDVADRAAVAIDNARLFQLAQEARATAELAADRISRLQRVTAAVGEALTEQQVGDVVISEGLPALNAAAGAIYLLSEDQQTFNALSYQGYPSGTEPPYMQVPVERPGPLHDVLQTRAPVWVETAEQLLARWPSLAPAQAQTGDAALAAVPLLIESRVFGVFHAAFRQPRSFSTADIDLLQAIASQGAQALDRARIYADERQARTEAERAVQLRDLFLSVASHELRTPLTSLLMQAQLFQRRANRDGTLGPREVRSLQVITDQARRLDRLITALLDISRIELGRLDIKLELVNATELVRRVASEVQTTSDSHIIEVDAAGDDLLIEGDELRLEQVFQNLLHNALKYSPDGGQVRVWMQPQENMIAVTVQDHGIGIPADALPNLFTRFFRAANADPGHISGMGIGLYVVKEIVSLHGGSVAVESEEGSGSRFTVLLPRAASLVEKSVQ